MAVRDGVVILLASFSIVTGTATNVAEKKPAWMSSALEGNHPASKAVDGDTRADEDRYIAHTDQGQSTAWWKVDLQIQVQSGRIILYFRTNYIIRRNGVHLYTAGTNSSEPTEGNLCHTVTGRPNGTDIPDVLNVTCPGTWRYLTVYTETDNDGGGAILDFAEVQVWSGAEEAQQPVVSSSVPLGVTQLVTWEIYNPVLIKVNIMNRNCEKPIVCVDGTYGPSCTRSCNSRHCKVSSSMCDVITGTCPVGGCLDGWMGVDCSTGTSTNVAEKKPAWMSSALEGNHPASKAVDGDTKADEDRYIAHTDQGQSTAWWKVDLQTQVQSARIILYFRTNYKYRRNGVHLYTAGTNSSEPTEGNLCHTVTGRPNGTDIPDVLNVTCPGTWRYLTVYTDTDNDGDGAILDFAEVQVLKCASGYYGANCGNNCTRRNCKKDSSCDSIQGLCEGGCAAGYKGTDCTEACTSQMYGPNCGSSCSARHCKTNSSTCDGVSGECLGGCEDEWREVDCSALVHCSDGRYGPGCTEFCNSRYCKTPSPACDVIGSCADGCREGWQNADCRTPCPSGTYGTNCSKSCDSRQCQTARTTCDHVSGACTTGCREGWIGADCTQRCKPGTYGPDCSRCGHCDVTCNVGDGRCPGECLEGFTGDRCDVDVRASVVKSGVIGGAIGMAIGMAVMLLLVVGLFMCLLKHGRLNWIPSNGADPKEGRKTDYTEGIPTHTPTPGVGDPDYTELNDVTRERVEKSQYDVIQNQVYENTQI